MQIKGEFLFRGTKEQVWALMNDETVLAKCTPGCERLTRTGDGEYTATLKMGLAAVKGTYEAKLQMTDRVPLESMTLRVEATGGPGFVTVAGRMELVAKGDATNLLYDWDVNIGGPIAMVGQRVLGGVAKWIVGEFFNTANKELMARQSEAER